MPILKCPSCNGEMFFQSDAETPCKHCDFLVVTRSGKAIYNDPNVKRQKELASKAEKAFGSSAAIKIAKNKKKEKEKLKEPIWFFSIDLETQEGPYSILTIAAKLNKGEIFEDTLIWSPNSDDWQPASIVLEKIDLPESESEYSPTRLSKISNKSKEQAGRESVETQPAFITASAYATQYIIPINDVISMLSNGELSGQKRGNVWYVQIKKKFEAPTRLDSPKNYNLNTNREKVEIDGFFVKLIDGDFGLAKTYWLFSVLVAVVINIFADVFIFKESYVPGMGFWFFMVGYGAYNVVCLIGTWRAANNYVGPKLWAILAKISVLLGWISICVAVVFLGLLNSFSN